MAGANQRATDMTNEAIKSPMAFTSYSWTTPEHRDRVRMLVDRLRGDGVDMILDVYRLKEGHDKYAFMEQMVTDPEVSKVLVICDKRYAENANARIGGVGTESIIISQEVYEKVDQNKFIPVVTEFDEQGKPYLPAYMKGRMFIDLSSEEKLAENYETLLRAIYDRPLHEEPTVGTPPSFLTEQGRVSTRTGFKLQMIKDAILKDRPTTKGLISDYLQSFAAAFEDFRFSTEDYEGQFGEKVKSSIHRFLPYRDEFIDFISFVSLHVEDKAVYEIIFEFFEGLLRYREPPAGLGGYDNLTDNFRFINRELFLYLIAALIRRQRFEAADIFMSREYFNTSDRRGEYHENYLAFTAFCTDAYSIEGGYGQSGGETGRLLRERASHGELTFQMLTEADFVLYLRSILHRESEYHWIWLPKTLNHANFHSVFPIFARGESQRGFEFLKVLLKVASKQDLEDKLTAAAQCKDFKLRGYNELAIKRLMNLVSLDTRP